MKEYSILSHINRIIFSIVILGLTFHDTYAQMQLEKLDRGVVAVSMGGTKVFVSWRWLGTEDDITFNLYRNGVKVNATPLTVANYTDNAGSTTASYTVTTIVNGVEQTASTGVKPWAQQYLKVPITAPAGGTTPDGVAYTYNANDASVADLDGDGQWEIILKWDPTNAKDNSFSGYTGNTFIDAYKLNGTRLWRIDFGRNIRAGAHYLDFMVYDFDGDGKAEMMARTAEATKDGTGIVIGNANADYRNSGGYILTGPEYITVFNGQTGKAMATKNLYPPRGTVADWGDNYGNRVDRFKACVAYLDGQRPSAVFTRGYYAKWGAEAIDWRNGQLTTRWTYMCPNDQSNPAYSEGAHSLSVADVDGDGKQEVITGSLILDDNGTIYYNTNIGHGDALHVSDLDPDLAGTEIMHIQEPVGNAGLYMYSGKTKNVLWRKATAAGSSEGPGRGVCADISAQYKGAESWVAGGGIAGVFDCKGNLTTLATPQSCNFLAWWDGDILRELLNNTMIDKYGNGRLLTAYNIAPIASNNGTKATPCLSGDIMGDWREEVIWRASANDALYIFTTTTPSTYKFRTLMSDPQYRVAIAWQNTGYNQPPHLSYYLGDGMTTPAKPNITVIPPANLPTTCSSTITSPATSFCTGGSVLLTANTGSSYKWFNGTTQVGTAATYTATAAGSYTVEVTNTAGCKATSAATTITVNALPVITQYVQIGTDTWATAATASVCEGNVVNLGPQPNLAAGWSWTGPNNFTSTVRNPALSNVAVSNAGNYIATYTDPNGCKATSTFVLQVTKPVATITSAGTSFCPGGSVVLTSSAGTSYKWFNGTNQVGTAATYTATTAGSYTVEVTNTTGCKATSAPTVITAGSVQQTPTITTPATSFCPSGSLSLTSSTGASYKWFNGTNQVGTAATYTATAAGSYTVEVTNAAGCKATSAPTVITAGSAQQTPTITSPSTSFCPGSSVVLTSSAGNSYKWFNGTNQVGTAATYTATAAGSYTVEVTNATGCKATSNPTVITVGSAQQTPTITSPATSFCTGGSVLLTSSTGASYKWFNGTNQVGTAATYTATAAGSYTVEVTNATGCKATSNPTVITVGSAQQTPTITSPATSFCTGGSVLLTSSTGASYKWFNGTTQVGTSATYTATDAGSYTVEVTNTSGCKATSAAIIITVGSVQLPPTITSSSTSFCPAGSVLLTSSIGASYKWFNGSTQVGTNNSYTVTTAGMYTVEVTNSSGCKSTAAIQITVSAPAATITSTANSFCSGSTVALTANSGTAYKWYNGTTLVGTGINYTASTVGTYTVEVTNTDGCKATSLPKDITATQPKKWYADSDGDGLGDQANTVTTCWQPTGYVDMAGDACPTDAQNSCADCAGVANGTAVLDNCNICTGGTTGKAACTPTATINGTTANIKVVPQPFDVNTTITIENYGNIKSITIISASGAIVESINNVNTTERTIGESLAAGLYSVIIQTEDGVYTTKIVKK